MQQKKIIIVICFYGKLPWYFAFFLHSCGANPTIDFVIFSDIDHTWKLPPNVTIIKKSLPEIKKLASEKLGFEVNIDSPYKLCDFKPAYGLIFSEFIKGYDYWGHSDIDVIYGDIRRFMNEDILGKYDFVSLRHDYTTGCFALYKNNPLMKNIFKQSKDYKTVFSNSTHFCFDECNYTHNLLTEGKSIFEIETEIESFTHVIRLAELNNQIRAHFDFILIEGIPGRIKFDHGKIIYKNTFEAILYHLLILKHRYTPKHIPNRIPDTYFISPTRIYFG